MQNSAKFLRHIWRLKKYCNQQGSPQSRANPYLVAIPEDGKPQSTRIVSWKDVKVKGEAFINQNKDKNIFYSPSLFKSSSPSSDQSGGWTEENFYSLKSFAVDLDFYKSEEKPESPDDWILERCERYDLNPPHYIVHSSQFGRQPIWLTYAEDTEQRPDLLRHVKVLREKMIKVFRPHADQNVNKTQLFRVPGSTNQKPERDNFSVKAERYADPEVPIGFYSDLFDPLYEVEPPQVAARKEEQSAGSGKRTIMLDQEGNLAEAEEHPVFQSYWKREPDSKPEGANSNSRPILLGFILLLKGLGLSQDETHDYLIKWLQKHDKEASSFCCPPMTRAYEGEGSSAPSAPESGLGWSAKVASEYLDLDLATCKDIYKYFESPSLAIDQEAAGKYSNRVERVQRVRKVLAERADPDPRRPVAMSLNDLSEAAEVPKSSLRRDLRAGIKGIYTWKREGKKTLYYLSPRYSQQSPDDTTVSEIDFNRVQITLYDLYRVVVCYRCGVTATVKKDSNINKCFSDQRAPP